MKTTIQKGDVWKLGKHILGCGSSLDKTFVDKVLGTPPQIAQEMRAIVTDPPYGVAYVENTKQFAQRPSTQNASAIVSDHLQTKDEYSKFTQDWMNAIKPHLSSYNAYYIFNSDSMFPSLRDGVEKAGFYYSQLVIWVKNTVVLGRKDYLPMHELIAYGWYGRHKMERSKAKSVIFHPKPTRSKLHPTMKPIGLLRKLIPNSTKIGEWIYDPFLGSGSTLMACEHLGRRCAGIEINPDYCSIIIARWEKLTGNKAEKI